MLDDVRVRFEVSFMSGVLKDKVFLHSDHVLDDGTRHLWRIIDGDGLKHLHLFLMDMALSLNPESPV